MFTRSGLTMLGKMLSRGPAKKLGGALQGKAMGMQEAAMDRGINKNFSRYASTLSPSALEKTLNSKTTFGANAAILAKAAMDSGAIHKMNADAVKKAIAGLRAAGRGKEANELEELRFDAVDPNRRGDALDRARRNGNYKKWSEVALNSTAAPEAMKELENLSEAQFTDFYKGLTASAKKGAETALQALFDDPTTGNPNIAVRSRYANITGNIKEAFTDNKGNLLAPEAEKYVQRLSPAQLGNIKDTDQASAEIAGRYITTAQASSVKSEVSVPVKRWIKDEVNRQAASGRPDAVKTAKYMNASPAWSV